MEFDEKQEKTYFKTYLILLKEAYKNFENRT